MNPEIVSLSALFTIIAAGCLGRINLGVLSFALAFLIGLLFGDMTVVSIAAGFPSGLFLRIVGITMLFSLAAANGTMEQLAWRAVVLVRANRKLVPLAFFGIAVMLASIGAGNFATTAMLAPMAMTVAARLRISAFLMSVMLVNGATAGAFSPIAPTGIVAKALMERIGLGGHEWTVYLNSLLVHSLVAILGYALILGLRRLRGLQTHETAETAQEQPRGWTRTEIITASVIAGVVIAVAVLRVDVGVAAFIGVLALVVSGAARQLKALKSMPWGVILMVCGVTTLVEVINIMGGMDLFGRLLARISSAEFLPGLAAFVAGVVSVYASSIGVVLPAFLPSVHSLVASFGGGNPLMVAYSINVGAHLVDISPVSPLGAMCLASVTAGEDQTALFRKLMITAWVMSLVGLVVCQILFGHR